MGSPPHTELAVNHVQFSDMARFLCPDCQEVVDAVGARFAFCNGCGAPLTIENVLPVQLIRAEREQPDLEAVAEPAGS
jgi:predicted amidophosphoribosyltransferase